MMLAPADVPSTTSVFEAIVVMPRAGGATQICLRDLAVMPLQHRRHPDQSTWARKCCRKRGDELFSQVDAPLLCQFITPPHKPWKGATPDS
jgi:hypothetical protein